MENLTLIPKFTAEGWGSYVSDRISRKCCTFHNTRWSNSSCHHPLVVKSMARTPSPRRRAKASELQSRFGCDGVQFTDAGGMSVAELKVSTGTCARVLLDEARVTSYKFRMWHGGLEELLRTNVSDDAVDGSKLVVTGGMAPSFAQFGDPRADLCDYSWRVESVKGNPDDHIQITLRCDGQDDDDGCQFYLQDVITLSKTLIASAVVVGNIGKKPLKITSSVSTHLAIKSTDAISATGLQGCSYYSPSEAALHLAKSKLREESFIRKLKLFDFAGQKKLYKTLDSNILKAEPTQPGKVNLSDISQDRENWFTEPDRLVTEFTAGVHKLYSMPPKSIRISDQGYRRSLVLQRHGFENLELFSPNSDGENPYVSVGYTSIMPPVSLDPKGAWRAAQVLIPDA